MWRSTLDQKVSHVNFIDPEDLFEGLTLMTAIGIVDSVIRKLGERLVQAFEDEEKERQQDRAAS